MKARYSDTVPTVATFDSSFWVHVSYMGLVEELLEDYHLLCTPEVAREFARQNPTGLRLRGLIEEGRIQRAETALQTVKLYGNGERAAINLALDRKVLLCIDDWKPSEAAKEAGVETINSPAFLIKLYREERISIERTLSELARMARRNTVRSEWIHGALRMAAQIKGSDPREI
jgi:predicted nucleic acid-binding protein